MRFLGKFPMRPFLDSGTTIKYSLLRCAKVPARINGLECNKKTRNKMIINPFLIHENFSTLPSDMRSYVRVVHLIEPVRRGAEGSLHFVF